MRAKSIVVLLVTCLLLVGCSNKYNDAYEKGLKYLTEGNYEQAITAFTEAIEIDPKQYKAYSGRASAYMAVGKTEDAVSDLKDALDTGAKAGEVVDEIINTANDSNSVGIEEVIDCIEKAGFLEGELLSSIPEELAKILSELVSEFTEKGKTIEDLIEYLNNLGFIEGDKTSELIKDLPAETFVQEIIDYSSEGKTTEDLYNDGYGDSSSSLYIGQKFRIIDIQNIINSIEDYEANSWFHSFASENDWRFYQFGLEKTASDNIYTLEDAFYDCDNFCIEHGSRRILINVYNNHTVNEDGIEIYYSPDDTGMQWTFMITSVSGTVIREKSYMLLPQQDSLSHKIDNETWKKYGKTFISDYKNALSFADGILKKYGWSVSDFYDTDTVLAYFEKY